MPVVLRLMLPIERFRAPAARHAAGPRNAPVPALPI
jgi:hypothetical protein